MGVSAESAPGVESVLARNPIGHNHPAGPDLQRHRKAWGPGPGAGPRKGPVRGKGSAPGIRPKNRSTEVPAGPDLPQPPAPEPPRSLMLRWRPPRFPGRPGPPPPADPPARHHHAPRFPLFELVQNALRSTLALGHKLSGRLWYRLGGVSRARHHFERVLDLRGGDFHAYVFLGRIAYREGDYLSWHREMEHARLTSPERFARLPRAHALFAPRAAGTLIGEAAGRAIWTEPQGGCGPQGGYGLRDGGEVSQLTDAPPGSGPLEGGSGPTGGADFDAPGLHDGGFGSSSGPFAGFGPAFGPERNASGDDFRNRAERERFEGRPPITPDEVAEVDWDRLTDRL